MRQSDDGASSSSASVSSETVEWRKQQLDRLERKFDIGVVQEPQQEIDSDEDLQPMWQQLERRVKNRRSLTAAERGGRTGRANVKRTDEDFWLEEGLYEDQEDSDDDNK